MFGKQFQANTPGQLYHLGGDGFQCQLIEPDPSLAAGIHYYWWLEISAQEVVLDVIPDNAMDLVVSPGLAGFSALYPPSIEPFKIDLQGPIMYSGVCFHTDFALDYFAIDAVEAADLEPGYPTTERLGVEPLAMQIQPIQDIHAAKRVFDSVFRDKKKVHIPRKQLSALRYMMTALDSQSISVIADKAGMSERQLRRSVTGLAGLSPKQMQRVIRLQLSLHELLQPDPEQQLDRYYDDSHRIKELKRLTGLTPGQIRKLAEKYNIQDG